MKAKDIIAPLAASISQLPWNHGAIARHLEQRLPVGLQKRAAPIALALVQAFPKGTAPDPERVAAAIVNLPEAARLIAHARKTGTLPDHPLTPPQPDPDPALAHLPLPRLATSADLANWLALSPEQLVRFADLRGLSARSPSPFAPHYRQTLQPKASGDLRLIEEPKPFLKTLQRRILHALLDHVPPHDAAFGFCKGRTCIQAAARHAGEAMVVQFDLADFFPNLGFRQVYALFRALGYPQPVARDLAGLCTVFTPAELLRTQHLAGAEALSQRHLPQGAPTSPELANLCAHALDTRLAGLARALQAHYSRYADDLTFSGDPRIAPILLRAVPQITREQGFHPNPAKTRTTTAHRRQTVTGVVVNQHVNINRDHYDHLKAVLHHLARPQDPRRADAAFLACLSGQIAWVEQVNPNRGQRLRHRFDALG